MTRKSDNPKNKRYPIALSAAEYETLRRAAESVGCSMASLVRDTALAAAKQILQLGLDAP